MMAPMGPPFLTSSSVRTRSLVMKAISVLYHKSLDALKAGVVLSDIFSQGLFEKATKMKYDIPNNKLELFDGLISEINEKIDALVAGV